MTPEELMKPRIKIIAHWPNMEEDFDSVVGEIIELPSDKWIYSDNEHCEENYFNDWPHLFQSIPWYAERKPEDMPEYVICLFTCGLGDSPVEKGAVIKTSIVPLDCLQWFLPATHEQYINSNKQP